jgi:hypothetical protein
MQSSWYLTAQGEFVALRTSDAELGGKFLGRVGHGHLAEGIGQGLPQRVFQREIIGKLCAPASIAQAVAEGLECVRDSAYKEERAGVGGGRGGDTGH